jgi:cytochrome c biogenesis protein CcmG, thiol:disulfide interchange protein DsbE
VDVRARVVVPVLAVVVVLAVAAVAILTATAEPEVVDFGAAPPGDAPEQPGDRGLDVYDVAAPGEVPPPDADLAPADWPATAAWIRREVDDGRPVLVNLFASWCIPCKREMPMLLEAAETETGFAFLGVATNDTQADARGLVEELDITIPTLFDTHGDDVAFAFAARGMPTTVVFDREGRLVGRAVGELTPRSLADLLDAAR